MLVRAPGVTTAATECNQYVSSVDFYPTMLELTGQPKDTRADVDGMSFVPLLEGKKLDRGPIFWHYPHYGNQGGSPSAAIRDGKWKLIQWLETDDVSLYDIDADIGEKNDLASQHPGVVLRMKNQLTAWQKDVGAKQLGRRD